MTTESFGFRFLCVLGCICLCACPKMADPLLKRPSAIEKKYAPKKRVEAGPINSMTASSVESRFALECYSRLKTQGNFFFSPFSLWEALLMASAGAQGNTRSQMDAVLLSDGLPGKGLVKKLRSEFEVSGISAPDFTLTMANGLWLEKSFDVLESYKSELRSDFNATLGKVDFINEPDASRMLINSAIEEQTRLKIKDLLPPSVINPLTRLVLTNAIYLKGKWKDPFNSAATIDKGFTTAEGKTVKVKMMVKSGGFNVAFKNDYLAVELPYTGEEFSMITIMPNNNLDLFEEGLNRAKLEEIVSELKSAKIVFGLPKFKIETSSFPIDALRELGMRDAFIPSQADFSNIDGSRNLSISNVLHKAFIQVDEEGTEAAAATAIVIEKTAFLPRKEVIFDRPFLSFIIHKKTGTILFMGRVSDPSKNN